MSEKQDYIVDHVGAENWQQVTKEFAGNTINQIKSMLSEMFANDDNNELAQMIDEEVNK